MRRAIVSASILVGALLGLEPGPAQAKTDVQIGIQIGAAPQLVVVPGTPVYYAPRVPYNYFFYGGQYYVFHDAAWYFAPTFNGPWAVIAVEYVPPPILRVPVAYYRVPPAHWKEHKHAPPPWAPAWGHRKRGKEDDD